MPFEIRLILPVNIKGLRVEKDVQEFGNSDTRISVQVLEKSSPTEDGHIDKNSAVPEMVRFAIMAEQDGVDAIVVDCMGDTGLRAIRKAVSIPALGPAQTSMHLAAMLGMKFAVITMLSEHQAQIRELVASYNLETHLGPSRSVGIPILAAMHEPQRVKAALLKEAVKAIREDQADVIILGCTSMSGMGPEIQTGFENTGISGIPVLDPIPLAIRMANVMITSDLCHSKRAFSPTDATGLRSAV